MNARDNRIKNLDICDASLANKPRLAAVYDEVWRREFRAKIFALPKDAVPGYPTVYWLPMLHQMSPEAFPADLQDRVEYGLDVVWDQMSERDRADMSGRLRVGDFSTLEELLAVAAFANEFGRSAIKWPQTESDQRKPEFFVVGEGIRWAVECRHLQDREEVRRKNEAMLQSGEPWVLPAQPEKDRERLRRAILEKIRRAQGGGPTVILLTSLSPWLMPEEMEETVRAILDRPNDFDLTNDHLPIAIACLFVTVVQGVWLCDTVCAQVGITSEIRDRIRNVIKQGFVARADTENAVSK